MMPLREEKQGMGWRHHTAAFARDVLAILTVIGIVSGVIATVSRPWWQPFANLPEEMRAVRRDVADLRVAIDESRPRLIEFQGNGQVVNVKPIKAGQQIDLLYSLRRNVSCETEIIPTFYDVDRGRITRGVQFAAIKAPVTATFQLFPVTVQTPSWLQPGRYVYFPIMQPVDCGVYSEIHAPPSSIFIVE